MDSFYNHVREWALPLLEGLACPRSLTVAILLKSGEWDQIANLALDPTWFNSPFAYYSAACATELFRKCADLPGPADRRREAAIENFWKSERQCFLSNRRLFPYVDHSGDNRAISGFIAGCRKKIAGWLGALPSQVDGRFGPGATYGDRGHLITIPDKITSRPTCTTNDIPFTFGWEDTAWARSRAARGLGARTSVRGNRFTTVPKDANKDRGIAIEPSINVFYQLGLGRTLKTRLLKAGIDLQNGQDTHRRVACDASKDGSYSTIDLSNASDTVSTSLVELFLPTLWYDTLSLLRSPFTTHPGGLISSENDRWVRLEKFSSMGNGFTFELETLLFLGIACQAMEEADIIPIPGVNVWVYGDDIIVPVMAHKVVVAALAFFGFTPNARKTFSTGLFRESCGGDFFDGMPVRAFYLKSLPTDDAGRITLANGIRRMMDNFIHLGVGSTHLLKAWHRVIDSISKPASDCRGPSDLGDSVIWDSPDKWMTKIRFDIRYIRCWQPLIGTVDLYQHFTPECQLAYALYTSGSRPSDTGDPSLIPRRGNVTGYRVKWVPYS